MLSTFVSTLGDDVAHGWDPAACAAGRDGDGIKSKIKSNHVGAGAIPPCSNRRCTAGHTELHTFYLSLLSRSKFSPPARCVSHKGKTFVVYHKVTNVFAFDFRVFIKE